MKRIADFLWVLALGFILGLAIGTIAGNKVTEGYKDAEIATVLAVLETERAGLAEANKELATFKSTLKGLAEGGQFKEDEIK